MGSIKYVFIKYIELQRTGNNQNKKRRKRKEDETKLNRPNRPAPSVP
jgi:hypothetical protein